MEVPIGLIRPSPYQPRLDFDLEDLKGSIMKDRIVSPLVVRQIDTGYELIDGERRTRLAKELGYETVPCQIIEADDEKAMRLVWRLNVERKDYTPKEKAYHFRNRQKEGMSLREIGRLFGYSPQDILMYVNVFKLPDEYQEAVWHGDIPIGNVRALEPLFANVAYATPEILSWLDQRLSQPDLYKALSPTLAKFKQQQVQKAQEAVGEVIPDISLETPEDYEKAAAALRGEARRRADALLTSEERAAREADAQARAEDQRARAEERQRRQEEEKRRLEEEAREKAKEELLHDPSFILRAKAMEARGKRLKEREAERAKGLEIGAKARDALDSRLVLMKASIEEMVATVKESSVDVIITDPPYSKEYLDCFDSLARFAFKALKPGKSLLVMVGQSYLPEVFRLLSKQMSYHWILAYLTPGGQSPQIWPRKINTFWKPVIWLTKGKYEGEDWHGDVFNSDVNDNDKRFHHWGQSESGISRLVEAFSKPDDVVCDPFLGGGTTAVVAIRLGRKFIGSDIDENALETCRGRVVQSYE